MTPIPKPNRQGSTSPAIVVLLAGIFLALIALIVVVALNGPTERSSSSGNGTIKAGETVNRTEFSTTAPPIQTVGDPSRIREVLQAGRTYRATVKFGFDARVEDKDWSVKQVTNVSYLAEMQVTRKIESNDGHRIVELRTFDNARSQKVLYEVEGVNLELGAPGVLILGALEYLGPGTTEAITVAQPFLEGFATSAAQSIADDRASKAFAHVDSLSGKKVRIVFVNDGGGIESFTPVDCTLSDNEASFVENTAVLSDCYIFPDVKVKPGEIWNVDARQFSGYFDPSFRGVPTGDVSVKRLEDEARSGKQIAKLSIERGVMELDSSDSSTRRIGSFTPRGTLEYNITDGFIQGGQLQGDLRIEELSKDHLLFEASFRTEPRLQIQYFCELLP